MSDAGPVLTIEHLSMRFGGLVAVNDVSLRAERGAITAIIGPNGAGKTTLFNCITGFYKPMAGMITLRRRDGTRFLLERMDDFQINRQAGVARTFQNIRLFGGMTCLENLMVAQHQWLMRSSKFIIGGVLGLASYRSAEARAIEVACSWLNRVELKHRADDAAGSLSYGEQRRLEIARAMCTAPELLCLDEPAAGLNPRESGALTGLLRSIRDDTGVSMLLIEHDMSVVMNVSDRVVVLDYGAKIAEGTPFEVKTNPRVVAAYLGVEDRDVDTVEREFGA